MSIDDDLRFYLENHATPEQREAYERNIWIGEAVLGWELTRDKLHNHVWKTGIMCKADHGNPDFEMTIHWADRSVDFWNSLDAVAHAEKKIAEMAFRQEYIVALIDILWPGEKPVPFGQVEFGVATATPRQRCLAMYVLRDKIEAIRAESKHEADRTHEGPLHAGER